MLVCRIRLLIYHILDAVGQTMAVNIQEQLPIPKYPAALVMEKFTRKDHCLRVKYHSLLIVENQNWCSILIDSHRLVCYR